MKNEGRERIATRGRGQVITVKVTVNGVSGNFVLDTGATYVSVKSAFAEKAKISFKDSREVTLSTANGSAKGRLTKADKVQLGKLQALSVPTVVQTLDDKSYGAGIDGLLGISFLSRFEIQMTSAWVQISPRGK